MKKLIIPALFAVCAVGQSAEDANLRANVGVGLGTMLFEAMGYTDTVLGQTLAATTNGSVSNQLFFITTGTGGAKPVDFVQNKPLRDYVNDNLDAIARDMAAGQGESLAAVAELAGIPVAQRAAFYAACQSRFSEVFASENVTSDVVVAGLAKIAS
ncbi:MAG: DUF3015 family protein [Planctomycetes bacterium]|nr:DUF3015 family protein [Planctomycetota bacterium]